MQPLRKGFRGEPGEDLSRIGSSFPGVASRGLGLHRLLGRHQGWVISQRSWSPGQPWLVAAYLALFKAGGSPERFTREQQ